MELLNAKEKYSDAGTPFLTIHFVYDKRFKWWWAQCPVTGFGFPYETLFEAVRRWRVTVTECRIVNGERMYVGVPA